MSTTNRRSFLQAASLAGAGYFAAAGSRPAWRNAASEQLNVASIGVGGKGGSDSDNAALFGNVVAICDVDRNTLDKKGSSEKFTDAEQFTYYRELFAKYCKNIDIVPISTPDHTHAPSTLESMRPGTLCHTQHPIPRTVIHERLP